MGVFHSRPNPYRGKAVMCMYHKCAYLLLVCHIHFDWVMAMPGIGASVLMSEGEGHDNQH
jgi:hypothetical protein